MFKHMRNLIATIDLTNDGDLTLVSNVVVSLDSDQSMEKSPSTTKPKKTIKTRRPSTPSLNKENRPVPERRRKTKLGDCPICFDPLGKSQLSSTKCGHVFCTSCLERALGVERRCPTCRRQLKGSGAYHPIYLGSN